MLVFITGVPGSGKTYKAVNELYKHFGKNSKDRDDRFLHCYTNINQFRFDLVDDRVKKFDYDDFKMKINQLHLLYKRKVSDEELNEQAKEYGLYKALFVIDEAHNYFQTNDATLVWWLTYHRHMYQDIYLITQNLALINSKYKPLAEYFYKAVPASLRLNKKIFKYNVFVDSKMNKYSKAKVEKLKLNPNVIELYHSGDVVKAPNFLLRFILFAIIFFALAAFVFYYLIYGLLTKDSNTPVSPKEVVKPIKTPQAISKKENFSFISDGYKYVVIKCNIDECYLFNKKIPYDVLSKLIDLSESKLIRAYPVKGTSSIRIYSLLSPQFISYFRSSNEKNSFKLDFFGSDSKKR